MKKVTLLLVFIFLHAHLLFSKQNEIDSLETVIRTCKEDSNKVNAVNAITQIYLFVAPLHYHKALTVTLESKQLSEKISYKNGLAVAYENFGNIYSYFGIYDRSLKNYLNELKIYESLPDSSMIIRLHEILSGKYVFWGAKETFI